MKTIFSPLIRCAALVGLSCGLFACSSSMGKYPISGSENSEFTGTYVGTYSGNDRGTFTIIVARDGSISGWGESVAIGAFSLLGQVTSEGKVALTGASRNAAAGAAFVGAIAVGTVAGTWNVADELGADEIGAFRGARTDVVEEYPALIVASPKQMDNFTY